MWANGKVLARGLSKNNNNNNPSCTSSYNSSQYPPGAQTSKSQIEDIRTTKRPASPYEDHHPELLLGLFDTRFSMFLEDTEGITDHDKHLREPHVVPEYEDESPRMRNEVDGIPELRMVRNIGEKHHFPSETWAHETRQTPVSMMVNSGSDEQLKLQNFPLFLRPEALKNKANGQASGTTRSTNGPSSLIFEQLKSGYEQPYQGGDQVPLQSPLMEKNGSRSLKGFQDWLDPVETSQEPIRPIATRPEVSYPPDEQSEADIFHQCSARSRRFPDQNPWFDSDFPANKVNGKPAARKSVDEDAATTSSQGASNDPKSWRRRCESSETNKEQVVPARRSAGANKWRNAKGHKLSERRRRVKFNKKISKLQKLIPNSSNKGSQVDKASVLDDAIQYTKDLQLQLKMMTMGTGLCMPPMVLPTGIQHIQAPHLAHFSPMAMRMNMGFGLNAAPFCTSAILGLPGQMLPKSTAPFIPPNGGHFAPSTSGRATPMDLPGSAPFSSSKDVTSRDQKL